MPDHREKAIERALNCHPESWRETITAAVEAARPHIEAEMRERLEGARQAFIGIIRAELGKVPGVIEDAESEVCPSCGSGERELRKFQGPESGGGSIGCCATWHNFIPNRFSEVERIAREGLAALDQALPTEGGRQ